MDVLDADTHVIESEATWKFFEPMGSARPPVLATFPDPDTGVTRTRWVIGGSLVPHPAGRGGQSLATPPNTGVETGDAGELLWRWRSLEDVNGRLADAQRRGTTAQVIFPTLFIAYLTDDPDLEVALCRSYNRYLADAWRTSAERFHWVVVPPLRSIDAAIEEMEFGRQHGAAGVLFRGIEGDRSLGDPYFDPIYREASQLDLPICVHTGPGCPAITSMADDRFMRNFAQNRVLPLIAFHDIVHTRVPERHPNLRIAFLEAASSWVPFLMHFLRRATSRSKRDPAFFGPQLFREYRLYVACEADEDIDYISQLTGPDHLIIGSDYGHEDQSAELDIATKITSRGDIDGELAQKILGTNARKLYGV